MISKFDNQPIIACSSGTGSNVAISLIRLSGFENFGSIEPLLKFSESFGSIEPRYSYVAEIIDENELVDEVVFTFFKAPYSYTGENLLEIGVHGNRINVEKIINLFCNKAGFRKAYGGEFSFRALRNQKLNLSQIEGLDLLLNANNLFSLKQGFSLLKGELQEQFTQLYQNYLNHKSALELNIDFLEDMGEVAAKNHLDKTFISLKENISKLYSKTQNDIDLTSAQITIFGPPNAGKSTFFNHLLGSERSIVSSHKGTTRDYISESIKIDSNYYEVVDTAGIRKSSNEVESLGIERSRALLKKSFFKILLINPLEDNSEFIDELSDIKFDALLLTHMDKKGQLEAKNAFLDSHSSISKCSYGTSLTDKGFELESRVNEIFSQINSKYLEIQSENPISHERQRETVKEIYQQCIDYENVLLNENDVAIISSELYIFGQKVEQLLGVISADSVLKNIFTNFCIGK